MDLDWLEQPIGEKRAPAKGPVSLVHAKKLFEVLDEKPKSVLLNAWTWGQIQRELFSVGGCGWNDKFGKLKVSQEGPFVVISGSLADGVIEWR